MRARNTTPLQEIVETTHTEVKTVRLPERADPEVASPVEDYLADHEVDVVTDPALDGQMRVESDGDVLAESGLSDVARFVEASPTANPMLSDVPSVVEHLDDTRFQSYDKRRMILASRLVEFRAWNEGEGTLHAGFQKLSKVDFQRQVYRNLSDSNLAVHVYGIDDWDRSENVDLTVHATDDPEVTNNWWVAYDGDGDDEDKVALLAHEISQSDWFGFWTYSPSTVDDILDRMAVLG